MLKQMRGKLFANTFVTAHYDQLADIEWSLEDKQSELATIQETIKTAKEKAKACKSGHAYEAPARLCQGTLATSNLVVLHNSQLHKAG